MGLLDYIRLGIKARDFFTYDNYTITLRPLMQWEINDAEEAATGSCDPKITRFLIQLRLGKISLLDKVDKELPREFYLEFQKFYNELDFHLVYHGMKDFMEDDFELDDVRQMAKVREIATKVLNISSAKSDEIDEVVRSNDGQILANIHYQLKVPITDEAWKLTPLQIEFLLKAHPDAPKEVAKNWAEFVNKKIKGEL